MVVDLLFRGTCWVCASYTVHSMRARKSRDKECGPMLKAPPTTL